MELKDRIDALLKYSNKNISEFSRFVGFKTPQAVRELLKGNTKTLSEVAQNKIIAAYPCLNESWLLTGEGEMLRDNTNGRTFKTYFKETHQVMVPLINIDSVGGIHSQNLLTAGEQYVEELVPFPNARPDDVAILQSGNSMSPVIPPGAVLQIRRVDDWQDYFGYGNVFVLWLKDDRRITKLVKRYDPDPKNYIMCCSYNSDADDEELPKSKIREVWKVVNVLIREGW